MQPAANLLGNIFPLETWAVLGNWFTGFSTLLVVFLALGLQIWYERAKRPRLRAFYNKSDDDNNRYVCLNSENLPPAPNEEPAVEELWLRLSVVNTSRTTARDVELRFMYAIRDDSPVKEGRPSWWFKVSNFNAFSISVPQKFAQPFDIAYIKNLEGVDEDLRFFLAIVPPDLKKWVAMKEEIESENANKLEVGVQYKLVFALVSSNANATYYELGIKASERESLDIPQKHLQGPDALRRRFVVSGPEVIKRPDRIRHKESV